MVLNLFCYFKNNLYICSPAKYAGSCNQLNLSAEKRPRGKTEKITGNAAYVKLNN